MFGLNSDKKGKGQKPLFKFPLETDLEDEKKCKKMMEHTEKQILDIKKQIKEGASSDEYEHLGTLLHAYSALLKIINKLPEKK